MSNQNDPKSYILQDYWKKCENRGMIIAVSGAQSTGKSTVINDVQEYFKNNDTKYPLHIETEITRDILNKGFSINEGGTHITQALILASHVERFFRCIRMSLGGYNVLMDRCAIDGYVYTNVLRNMNASRMAQEELSVWDTLLNDSKEIISTLQGIDKIFYTDPGDAILHDDGVRSTNSEFRTDVINSFNETLITLSNNDMNVEKLRGTEIERCNTVINAFYFANKI